MSIEELHEHPGAEAARVGLDVEAGAVAIAHEWIAARDGSVKTFEAMAQAIPAADLYALTVEPGVRLELGGREIASTFLNRWPQTRERRALTLPIMPLAWRRLKAKRHYDVVVTSSHACAKAFPEGRAALHRCYCYTPMRYAWHPGIDQRTRALQPLVHMAGAAFRRLDRRWAEGVDAFAAISTDVAERISDAYGRSAHVLPPPVDTNFFTPDDERERTYVLAASRFVPYKRLDLAIEACSRAGLPLVIAGSGPDEGHLRRVAANLPGKVSFEISPSDVRLRDLYRGAQAFLFPAFEDFGIMPVEAQACGTPVVAFDQGGSRDTVIDSLTGIRTRDQSADAFADALRAVCDGDFESRACRRNAERFSRERFIGRFKAWGLHGITEATEPPAAG